MLRRSVRSDPLQPHVAHQASLSIGILQARILEWVAVPFPQGIWSPALQACFLLSEPPGKPRNTGVGSLSLLQGSSQPRDQTQVSRIAGRFFTS